MSKVYQQDSTDTSGAYMKCKQHFTMWKNILKATIANRKHSNGDVLRRSTNEQAKSTICRLTV